MADIVLVGYDELMRKFCALGAAAQEQALVTTLKAGGTVVLNAARNNIKSQGLIETRTLSRSLDQEVVEQSSTHAAVEIGTNLEYAAIHEFGGTIRAKNTKYLAIPVGTYKRSPSTHTDLKLRKTKKGNLIMVDESGKVQYVLKTSVTIPAQPYLRPALNDNESKVVSAMAKSFKILVENAFSE